jgi:hypothetical protein
MTLQASDLVAVDRSRRRPVSRTRTARVAVPEMA